MGSENSSNSNNNNLNTNPKTQDSIEGLGTPRKQPFRKRLYSDPQDFPPDSEMLPKIRRHSLTNVTELVSNLHNSTNVIPSQTNDSKILSSFDITRFQKK